MATLLVVLLVLLAAAAGVAVTLVVTDDDDVAQGDAADDAVPTDEPATVVFDVDAVLDRLEGDIVAIETSVDRGETLAQGAGSGIAIEDDLVLTNAHVVQGASEVRVVLPDGRRVPAAALGALTQLDVALLALDEPALEPVALGSSSELEVGDPVVAVGNALNLGATPTVTSGIVSASNRTIRAGEGVTLTDLLQTDAAINPGNSGGALLDARGEVVGINTAVAGGMAQNIGFAIAIDAVRPLLPALREGAVAFLGVATAPAEAVSPEALERFGHDADDGGAFVLRVEPGSPADDVGLAEGDLVVSLAGDDVESSSELVRIVAALEPGSTVDVAWRRDGERTTAPVTLGERAIVP